jgi:dTDP-4-amino-4,6-dideoxyglucose
MEPYRSEQPEVGARLPETERLAGLVLALPTGETVGEAEIARIAGLIRFMVENGRELTARAAIAG